MEFTRNLANEPAEYATPTKLAEVAKSLGLETKIYDRKDCEKWEWVHFLPLQEVVNKNLNLSI